MRGLSPVAASGGHSSSRCAGLSVSRPLPLRSTGSRRAGSVAWLTGLVVPWHVGSSQTRARTRVPCSGRQTLNHCAIREAPHCSFHLHFQGDILIYLLTIQKFPVQVLCPFFYWVVCLFSLLICRSSLCILYMSPLIDIHMANIFSHSLWFAFSLLVQL